VRDLSTDEHRCDQELWDAAMTGEADAFGELFERHHGLIYNFCFRRTGSWSTAEDLMAVVFLEAWRTRRGMQLHEGSLLPWLYAIATNVTRHQHRSTGRHQAALARVASRVTNIPDHADEIIDRMNDEQRMRQVLGAFTRLPQRERDVLELAAFASLDYAQIAAALGIPVGTVRSRLSRGRSRLRGIVDDIDRYDDEIKEAQL
jgi:RNA polymerase sigma factor (sigma-70 family)